MYQFRIISKTVEVETIPTRLSLQNRRIFISNSLSNASKLQSTRSNFAFQSHKKTGRDALSLSDAAYRLKALDDSAWAIHIEASLRKQAGEPVILLTIGDPDFETPQYIVDEVTQSLHRQRTHYCHSAGEATLRNALAELETKSTGKVIDPKQVSIFNGATSAIHASLSAIANPGQNIITCQPYYLGYESTFAITGVEYRTAKPAPPLFKFDLRRVLDLVDENTIGILVNTPSNPMGNLVSAEELVQIYEECTKRNLWLISDEVYSMLYYEEQHVSLANVVPNFDNVIVIDSLSKSHAMSGWRVGWTLTSKELTTYLQDIALATFFSGCPFVQDAATVAIRHHSVDVDKMRHEYRQRRDYTMERVNAIPGLSAISPAAGMFLMVNVHEDGDKFARNLLDDAGVSVLPGSASGDVLQEYVRIGLTQDVTILEEAWDRIEKWLKER